ncbi:MAG: rRNA maturation RNase YbeY [Planctomycetota bacterium]|jgi:probable rRNA maturation factor
MITAAITIGGTRAGGTVESPEGGSTSEPDSQPEPEPEPAASGRQHRPEIEVVGSCVRGEGLPANTLEWLQAHLAQTLAHLPRPVRCVNVRVVDEPEMRELHRRHLGCDEATDVLAFSESAADQPIEADIAVCLEVARRSCAGRGHAVEHELLLYALHGLLHCAGHEDKTTEGFRAMHAEEDRILAAIGVGPVFKSEGNPEP